MYALLLPLVQSLSCVRLFVTPWITACQSSLSFTISHHLLKLMSISQWCHPTISSSVSPFSSCLQCFLASGSFPMTLFFASGGQSIGALASASVLPKSLIFHFCFFHIQMKWLLNLSAKSFFEYLNSFSCHKEFSHWIFCLKKKSLFFFKPLKNILRFCY